MCKKAYSPLEVINFPLLLSQELGPLEDLQYDNFVWCGLMRICAGKYSCSQFTRVVVLPCPEDTVPSGSPELWLL